MQVKRKSESGVAMQKLHREEWKLGRTSSGIHGEKKSSRLLKVGRRLTDSSESESFEAMETKLKLNFSVEDESSVVLQQVKVKKMMIHNNSVVYRSFWYSENCNWLWMYYISVENSYNCSSSSVSKMIGE